MNFEDKALEQEFINSLVSLSAFEGYEELQKISREADSHVAETHRTEAYRANVLKTDALKTVELKTDALKTDERFYFMCGWDRLMTQFRVACETREDPFAWYSEHLFRRVYS